MQGVNIRWQKYKRNRLSGMNCYNAAIAAGYSNATARAHALRLETKIMVEKGGLVDELERAGLTDRVMAQSLVKLCQANKVICFKKVIKKDKDGNQKVQSIVEEVPDFNLQLSTYELICRLKGYLRSGAQGEREQAFTRLVIVVKEPVV